MSRISIEANLFPGINIGIVCSPWLGGSGVVGSELARYLAKTGKYNVVYIGPNFPFRLNRNDVYFHKVENIEHSLFATPLQEVALVEGIVEAVMAYKLDIIHAHFAIPFAFCALQAREILKKMGINIKVVSTLHGTDVLTLGQKAPATLKYVLEQSNAVTAVSNDLAYKTRTMYNTKKNIQVIYNFIDLNQGSGKRANTYFKKNIAKNNEKIFIHISNFRPIKRVADTIKVFSKVSKIIPSRLLLIGDGPEMETAKDLSKSIENGEYIQFIGSVKNPYQYLQIADGVIVTSQYESFCLVALEAMAIGVPVFSTNVGGISEVIKHRKSGYFSEKKDYIESLSSYIIKHFTDEAKVESMKNVSKEIAKNFATDKIIPKYEQIYLQLLKTNKTPFPFKEYNGLI